MPTRGRVEFARMAVEHFLEQDYPEKELIVLDDDDDPSFGSGIPDDPRIQYHRTAQRMNIPEKRNQCCELATGSILMHFDSDDWSAPGRMSDQVRRLEESGKSVTGYHSMLFLVHPEGEWRRYRGFAAYAVGTSLAYRKEWWARRPFLEIKPEGEDNDMVAKANKDGQFIAVDGGELMFARIHPGNAFRKDKNGFYRVPTPVTIPRHVWDFAAAPAR